MTKKIQVSRPVCSATVAGRVFGPLKAPKNQEGDSPNFVEFLLTPALYSDPMVSALYSDPMASDPMASNFVEILLTPALYSDPMVYNPQDRHIDTDMSV